MSYETQGFTLDDSGRRVVVDPVCRIEGHMRIEVNLDANNVIRNAVSTGTMWRGLEVILKGRDPRDAWAFTERICGVCTGTHALTSVRAVEDALSISIPENAHLIRNLMQLTLYVHDHLVHFYHLHALDWVDVVSALKADPKKTSELAQGISAWPLSSPGYFRDVRNRLQKFIDSGQLGPFSNAYWGNPAYKLPPEANLMAVAHYLEALDFQKEIVKIHAIFGGKNPHPNWLVGGVPCAINLEGAGAVGAVNMERLNLVKHVIDQATVFIEQVYIPDLIAIAGFYKDWLYGGGIGSQCLLSYGDIPDRANGYEADNLLLPRGAIIDGNLDNILPVDLKDPGQIQEFVTHSWYRYPDESQGLHPFEGITEPDFTLGANTKGKKTRVEAFDEAGKYSWIKAPRWRGHAMEVGCLARMALAYLQPTRYPMIRETIDDVLKKLGLPLPAIFSTLGRTAARGVETRYCVQLLQQMFARLMANLKAGDHNTANIGKWEPAAWPAEAKGAGFTEAPRGALGHWISIKNGKIDNYQCVVPTTWNGSPRDPKGQIGAFEASLLDTPLAKADEPLEILRTLHSFDPCLACSTHVMRPDGQEMAAVSVR
ncbi:MAG: nickel-dependent hydrogenase large subunit [Zoogloeaceae bacterium]|jgi:hydrogenase large subunit|nr:nickel-dependent hydrogenase large subunit [Zoogloeaceae bacterium]